MTAFQQFAETALTLRSFIVLLVLVGGGWAIFELKVQLSAANKVIDLILAELNQDKGPENPGIVALPPKRSEVQR